jgi:hypothetical protein
MLEWSDWLTIGILLGFCLHALLEKVWKATNT